MNTLKMTTPSEMVGKTIKLILMNDPYPVSPGTIGTIFHVDDLGQYHVKWECGRTLAVIPELDEFIIQKGD